MLALLTLPSFPQKHMRLRRQLVGAGEPGEGNSERDLTLPLSEETLAAMARAHGGWGAGEGEGWVLDVFVHEYLLLPRYPCFEEERVGTWGEGGKARAPTSLSTFSLCTSQLLLRVTTATGTSDWQLASLPCCCCRPI